ncbi:sensor histidine kinase [Pararoseomonas indoligenes]|uniref:histidine kinase n=1 Tax=Roseomonas indoligenes TaxID=2820811 RepID=A0A940N1E4_9PROT|nr:HAMP domain-containing sensor histidine kinase [Pararoseomonas indoligenes]MBP0494769.1 HAMP domain-containing histidine kinase [Pararoseomonas indoligenes]
MRLYLLLHRLRVPFGYIGKFFIVAFVAIHLPLTAALILLLRDRPADWTLLTVLLAATLLGTVLSLLALRALLAPVRLSEGALRAYEADEALPDLPVGLPDLAGRLMTTTQETLASFDTALTAARGARQEAIEAVRRRERALAEVTHELRTSLNAVLGFAELLQMQPHGPLGHKLYAEFVNDIADGGQHMLTLIEDVQRFAALRDGPAALDLHPVDLAAFGQRAARLLRAEAAGRDMDLQIRIPHGLRVMADSRSLLQILLNLLGNAVKYAGRGRRVALAAERTGSTVTVRVVDTGPGLTPEDLAVALEPFGRVRGTGERGTGLGLPLVRTLVELQNGEFALESAPGRGTTARFTLRAA